MNLQKLEKLVKKSGKTVNQIQTEAGMSTGSLYRLLSGKANNIELKIAFRLADVLGVDVNEFREK